MSLISQLSKRVRQASSGGAHGNKQLIVSRALRKLNPQQFVGKPKRLFLIPRFFSATAGKKTVCFVERRGYASEFILNFEWYLVLGVAREETNPYIV